MENPDKVVDALPPEIDEEESAILSDFRDVRRWGFGRIEVVVVGHRMETLHATKTRKRKDWKRKDLVSSSS